MSKSEIATKPRGRRPGQSGTFVGVRLQPGALEPLDNWRKAEPDQPSRPEAIRRILRKEFG